MINVVTDFCLELQDFFFFFLTTKKHPCTSAKKMFPYFATVSPAKTKRMYLAKVFHTAKDQGS